MSLFNKMFDKEDSTAFVAKNRLMFILAQERGSNSFPFIEDLRKDIIEVIEKYIVVKDIKIITEKNHDINMLEVEITLGDNDKS
jgi:cell division topological specificity factor